MTQDAEISVRLQRFEHQELIVRNIGEIAFGLYASVAYLARFGEPDVAGGCPGHQLITFLDADLSQQANWLHEHVGRALVVLKAESYETAALGRLLWRRRRFVAEIWADLPKRLRADVHSGPHPTPVSGWVCTGRTVRLNISSNGWMPLHCATLRSPSSSVIAIAA